MRNKVNDIKINATKYTISQSNKIKILGVYITAGLCYSATINSMVSKINYRLSTLKKVFKYTNKRTAKMLTDSIIISVFKYGAPLLTNCNYRVLQKMNTLLLKCSTPILGFNSYK